ncbi:MAG: hypothetical protein M3P53_10280 [Actinomycetota bacterium]|nr:hypothetical protein [Actinomycetota bacterium]
MRNRPGQRPRRSPVYTSDVLLNTAPGLYEPSTWTKRHLTVDLIDKLVQAEAAGAIFDRIGQPDSGG